MKLSKLAKNDWLWAACISVVISLVGWSTPVQSANDYYRVAAHNYLKTGSLILSEYPSYFSELIPTERGMTIALPPFPLIPVMLGIVAGIDEVEVTQIGIGVGVALMFLILRQYKQHKLVAMSGALLYFLTTPLLFFFSHSGYWFSAQVWGVVGAQLAWLYLLKKNFALAGIGTAIAILSRINLGTLLAIAMTIYIYKTHKLKSLLYFLIPASVGVAGLLAWNHYRFGSIFVTGYGQIPGVLDEPWYTKGIMHPSYMWENLKQFLWQRSTTGEGIGIVWMQPYLLLVPFIINKQNWWLIVLGVAQFALVLAHGYTGAYQFDYRFLMDSLWIFVPLLLLEKRYLRQVMIWGCFIFALIMHIP